MTSSRTVCPRSSSEAFTMPLWVSASAEPRLPSRSWLTEWPRRRRSYRCDSRGEGLPLAGSSSIGWGVNVSEFFVVLIAILVAAKLLGELAEAVGQPAVLGELIAGI